eukprot:3446536-Pleurochrysis_carterae.AAC.1
MSIAPLAVDICLGAALAVCTAAPLCPSMGVPIPRRAPTPRLHLLSTCAKPVETALVHSMNARRVRPRLRGIVLA